MNGDDQSSFTENQSGEPTEAANKRRLYPRGSSTDDVGRMTSADDVVLSEDAPQAPQGASHRETEETEQSSNSLTINQPSSPSNDVEVDGDSDSPKQRPRRNVRKPLLLRHEMAVAAAAAAESSSFKTRSWKTTPGKRGSRGCYGPRGKRGSFQSSGRGRGASNGSPVAPTPSLMSQRRPRGRPRMCHGGPSPAQGGRGLKQTSMRGSHSGPNGRQWGGDDDDDFGLTLHHKRQISESLEGTRGQRTRQLIPRRAANASIAASSDQLQDPLDVNDSNASESTSPLSSKSASPSPTDTDDVYNPLPHYRMLQYGIVLGDINRKFLNQSFKPV